MTTNTTKTEQAEQSTGRQIVRLGTFNIGGNVIEFDLFRDALPSLSNSMTYWRIEPTTEQEAKR